LGRAAGSQEFNSGESMLRRKMRIAYLFNGQMHDYMPDFIVRLKTDPPVHLILETKGYDPREEVKSAAAQRWVDAVNAEGSFGQWRYAIVKKTTDVPDTIAHSKSKNELSDRLRRCFFPWTRVGLTSPLFVLRCLLVRIFQRENSFK
jgi:hypothetical protein